MEKIRIKTAGPIQLTAYKDKIQFIVLEDLLNAMKAEYIEEVIDYIKQDTHWFTSIKTMDLPDVGKKEVVPITTALGLIHWVPDSVISFMGKHEVFQILTMHVETYLEFYEWKISEITRTSAELINLQKETDAEAQKIIEAQEAVINSYKEIFNHKID